MLMEGQAHGCCGGVVVWWCGGMRMGAHGHSPEGRQAAQNVAREQGYSLVVLSSLGVSVQVLDLCQ